MQKNYEEDSRGFSNRLVFIMGRAFQFHAPQILKHPKTAKKNLSRACGKPTVYGLKTQRLFLEKKPASF